MTALVRIRVFSAALAIVLPGVALAQQADSVIFRDSAYSTVLVKRYADSTTALRTTVSYHVISPWSTSSDTQMLIREVSEQYSASEMEGERGTIGLEARVSDGGLFNKPAWTRDLEANTIEYLPEYFRSTVFGCCGSDNAFALYRYSDGQQLMELTSEPARIEIPNTRESRVIGVLGWGSMLPLPEFEQDTTFVCLLSYVNPQTLERQQLVLRTHRRNSDNQQSVPIFDSISFTPANARDSLNYMKGTGYLQLWSADGKSDPRGFSNFTINLVFEDEDYNKETVRIPVEQDRMDATNVHTKWFDVHER